MSRRKSRPKRRTEEKKPSSNLEYISSSRRTTFILTEVKMKFTRVALAAAVVIACVCVLQTTAVPFTQAEDEHHVESETPQVNELMTETSQEQTNPLALFRTKRQSHLSLCRYCCNCCRNKGCGYCCKF
ncbi:hepcidin-1 isoform X2 [Labeo rohita]|uniref:hepcidin-1 isoform X2 n=1 Tax=Labeo rohita TaxID=84645 RepID=UPI0021E29C30|nr:hepcidin-1 isoform X2 [Labeo rohita]